MDAGAPGERNNQHGEPRRSLEGLDCLGMLPATPANMRPACGTWRRPSVGNGTTLCFQNDTILKEIVNDKSYCGTR